MEGLRITKLRRDLIPADMELGGIDGNAFAILGAVQQGLREAGNEPEVVSAWVAEASSGDYSHLLVCAMEAVGDGAPAAEEPKAECYGCDAKIAEAPGNYYCESCVAEQSKAAKEEREAFDAYHAFADRIARGGR